MSDKAATWQAEGLRQLAENTPFHQATRHWQDKALACFLEDGYPSTKVEAWRYLDVSELLTHDFSVTDEVASDIDLSAYTIDESYRLVFVNGVLNTAYSTFADHVLVLPLQELLNTADETLLRELRIELDTPYFACLNSALMRQGAYIKLKPQVTLDKPLHILHVTTAQVAASMQTLRFFVDADKNTEAVILEEHVSLGQSSYFNNIVTQLNLNFDSRLHYYKFQRDSDSAYHFATTIASLSADSHFNYYLIADGAKQNREDLFVRHYERGSQAHLVGFYHAKDVRQTVQHTRVDHFKGMCSTYQSYKGIAKDRGRAVFDGQMIVHPDAKQSSVHQSNHNLLLSNKAEVDTKPNLEIYTDDVTASHGATIGQLDETALFYLQSRGISADHARELLIAGFIDSLFEKMPINPVTAYLQRQFLGERAHA